MVSADENRPIAGSGQINGKTEPGNKPDKRRRKPNQKPGQKLSQKSASESDILPEAPEPLVEAQEEVDMPAASAESSPAFATAADASPSEPATLAASAPVSVQAITNAYGDYTRKSMEQTSSFFEQLVGSRSLNRAFELQSEFAQRAFETFVDESRKIRELHRELAKQRLRNFEGFVMGRRAAR
jgi:hypothetical protein